MISEYESTKGEEELRPTDKDFTDEQTDIAKYIRDNDLLEVFTSV